MANIYDLLKELKKIEVEFTDPASKKVYISKSHIKRLDDNTMLIDPPSINNIICNLEINQDIKIVVKNNEGYFTGSCLIMGKELSSTSGIIISYPTNVKFNQRREYLRVALNLDVALHVLENSYNNSEKIIDIVTHDISGTGFSYISDEPLQNYYSILAKISLSEDNEQIETSCDHVYSKKFVTMNKVLKYKNALMYTCMNKYDNDRLIKAIFKFQLEQRKKGIL